MKKILITGASGFIGRHCLPYLQKNNYEIHATTIEQNSNIKNYPNVIWHQCNLLDTSSVKHLFKNINPTHLLHLSWFVEPQTYLNSPNNIDWLESSIRLIKEFINHGGKRVAIAGTCFEYDLKHGYCSESTTPLKPTSLYAKSKNSLLSATEELCSIHNISYAWCRIFFTYGPYEYPTRFIPSIINSLLSNKKFTCLARDDIRDYLYVEDVAHALVSSLDSTFCGSVNIASGNPTKIKDLVQIIAQEMKKSNLIDFKRNVSEKLPIIHANTTRLCDVIGFSPSFTLEQGIKKTIDYILSKNKIYSTQEFSLPL